MKIAIDGRFSREAPLTGVGLYAQYLAQTLQHAPFLERFDCREFHSPYGLGDHPQTDKWLHSAYPTEAAHWGADVLFSPAFYTPLKAKGVRRVVLLPDCTSFLWPQTLPFSFRCYLKTMVHMAVRCADQLCTYTETGKEELLSLFPFLSPENVTAIGAGLPRPWTGPTSSTKALERLGVKPPYMLSVGSLEPRKNLGVLVEAMETVHKSHPEVQWVIAGNRAWDREIADTLARNKGGATLWLGYIDAEVLWELYSHASLFAFPSLYEGFGLPLLEALTCRTPVLASQIPVFTEILGEGKWLVPSQDSAAWTRAIQQALDDPTWAAMPTEAVLKRWTWQNAGERVAKVFEK